MDKLVLAALAERQKYNSLISSVPSSMMSPETGAMLAWYKVYFESFPEHKRVDVDTLQSLIKLRSGNASAEQVAVTIRLSEELRIPADEVAVKGIITTLTELDFSGKAGALVEAYNRGEEINLVYELNQLAQKASRSISQSSVADYIDTPIGDLLAEVSDDRGIKLRILNLLLHNISGLSGGSSIAIGARPDKGKTSLIAALITDIAPQIAGYFGPNRPILWVNNEGSGKRIIPRIYQAALKLDLNGIIALSNQGKLVPAYTEAIGGVQDLIRVKDMHGASLPQIEQVIESMQPAVVIFDMLANVRLGGPATGGNKADAVEQAWQEVREMSVRHDFIAMSTVQISAEGGNMLYPPYSALKDSKTGIQGATDIILMMGSLDNVDFQTVRGLSTPKNKFAMPGKKSYVQGEVFFDASRCLFEDGAVVAEPK
jgi:hypothetical protein